MNKATLSILAGLGAIKLATQRGSANKMLESEVRSLGERLENKYNLIPRVNQGHLHIYLTQSGFLKVSSIRIPEQQRGKGIGTKIMNELIVFADRNGLNMALTPAGGIDNSYSGRPSNKKKLTKWYRTFGFVPNKGRNKDYTTRETMIRFPAKPKNGSLNREKLIIVDVQPGYAHNIGFNVGELIEWATENFSEILVLWNGPDLGYANERELNYFYFEKLGDYLGDYDKADRVLSQFQSKSQFLDKGYGFFRDLMSNTGCFPREEIIALARYMINNHISDIRDLTPSDLTKIEIPGLLYNQLEQYSFYIPELGKILPRWNNAVIVGGAEDECMEEVTILGQAQGMDFHKYSQFIY